VRFPLSYKLSLFAAILILSHLAAVGWAAVALTRQTVVAAELDKQHAVIETTVTAIDADLADAEDGVHAIARLLVDETIAPDARISLAAVLVESNSHLDNAVIYDADGARPLAVQETPDAVLQFPEQLSSALMANATATSVATGLVYRDATGELRVPLVFATIANGAPTGYVAAFVSLAGLQARVEEQATVHFAELDAPLFVVDASLRILAHADSAQTGAETTAEQQPALQGVTLGDSAGRIGRTGEFETAQGRTMVGTVLRMPTRPWTVVAQVPADIVYGPVEEMKVVVYATVGVAIVVAMVASLLLSRRITSPLERLSDFAQSIAHRDFDQRFEINTQDELAVVGRAMSLAARDLKDSEQRIRQEVEIRSDLGRYLPAELVDKVVRREQEMGLGGQRRPITVMFADIVAFTPLTEKLPPEEVVTVLNELFTIVTEIVFRHGGTVDKFIGDCVMAIWGAPTVQSDHAGRALEAAEEIISWLEASNATWQERYGIEIQVAIGINTGEAVVGNVGSETRMEYTAIGDTVNVAARLEAIARPRQILITEATATAAGDGFDIVELGPRALSGRAEPLNLYEVRA